APLFTGVKLRAGIECRGAPDEIRITGTEPKARIAAHTESRRRSITPRGEGAIRRVDMLHEFEKVLAIIEVATFPSNVVGSATVKAGVVPRNVAVGGNNDHIMRCNEGRDLRNGVEAFVVMLESVAIAMAVEVVNDGITGVGGRVLVRKEDAVVATFVE